MIPPDAGSDVQGIRFDEPKPPPIPDHELIRCIGRGSYGEVWLARNIMGTYRAVKVVYRRTFSDARPFEREFAGLQRFEPISRSHESQLDILHIGRSDDWFYYVLELADDEVTGPDIAPANYRPKTLRAAHEGQIQYTADETLEIGLALTTALEHLHKNGLVHRDIKPSNVIFVNGLPKLADIGLVSSVDATRSFVGTEGFVPPEGPGAPTGDLYSLGKVLYELCTGRDRKDYPELPTAIAESPDRERLLELNAIIARACRENPKDRYPSAEAMRQDLLLMQSGRSVRRVQKLERQLRFVRRAGAAVTALAVLILAAWFYQARQTRIVKELADENLRLADESHHNAEESRKTAKESNDSVVRLLLANGNQLVDRRRYAEALPWLVEAFKRVQGDPERERIHRIRLNSVFGQVAHIDQVIPHDGAVMWCDLSPDGRRVVTACNDHTTRVWDVATGEPLTPPLQHKGQVLTVEFSPDGKRVVTGSDDGSARVWDSLAGEPITPWLVHDGPCVGAEFSSNGAWVLTGGQSFRIWDAGTGELLWLLPGEEGEYLSAWFSPDGETVLTGWTSGEVFDADGKVLMTGKTSSRMTVWRWKDREPVFPSIESGMPAFVHGFSPDGKLFLASFGTRARGWSTTTGQPQTPELVHDSPILRATFSPDGTRILTADQDGTARLWDAKTGESIGSGMQNYSVIYGFDFSPDGHRVVTYNQMSEAKIWDSTSGQPVGDKLRHGGWVFHAMFSPDGLQLATASTDGLLRIWNLESAAGPEITLRGPPGSEMWDARFSPDGNRVLTALGDSARIWDVTGQTNLFPDLSNPESAIGLVAFSGDGSKFLLGSGWQVPPVLKFGTNVSVWDAVSGDLLCVLTHPDGIYHAAFSPDGRHVLTASADNTARVWDAVTGQPTGPILSHSDHVQYGEFSPDGSRVVTVNMTNAQVWDWTTGRQLLTGVHHDDAGIHQASFSPDGRKIVTCGADQKVRIWDAQLGELLTPPLDQPGRGYGLTFAPDGRSFATWSSAWTVRVWATETGIQLLPTIGLPGRPHNVEFSPDGSLIATSCDDGTARLWDAATGEPVSIPLRHPAAVQRVTFHPSQPKLLTACSDGAARIWRFGPLDWPLEQVVAFSDLHSAETIDRTLSASSLTHDRLVAASEVLRKARSR